MFPRAPQSVSLVCIVLAATCPGGCGRKAPVRPPEFVKPATIEDLTARGGAESVDLAWSRPRTYADGTRMTDLGGFMVQRASAAASFAPIATLDVNDRDRFRQVKRFGYSDRDVVRGVRYRYRVVAFTVDHYASAPSNTVEIAYEPIEKTPAPEPAARATPGE